MEQDGTAEIGPEIKQDSSHAQELVRVSRSLATFTRATEVLIHATDEQQLLNDVCRTMVETGGFLLAWIGYLQHDDDRSIWPVARFGKDSGYIAQARLNWNPRHDRGQGPTGRAVTTGKAQHCLIESDPGFTPWRDAALGRGFRTSLCVPLHVEGNVAGVLHLYSSELLPFDQDELHLLESLARNIAYGIAMQRTQFERRRAERELKESEGRYRSLVELSPDAIVVHTQGVIIFSNSAADSLFRITGLMPLVGRRIMDLVHPEDQHSIKIRLESDDPGAGPQEERLFRLDGTSFIAEVTSAPIIFHGVHARQVVIRDVSERKQVHAQLVQTAKLATLGEMAAGMAHELSQPTNIIRMAAEGALLLMGRNKADQAFQTKQFIQIAAQAGRMAEIIDHIRIFSRKETGEVMIFDACDSVALALELLTPQMSSSEIEVKFIRPSRPCAVRGRPVQLEQVILNLLSNAADAIASARDKTPTPERGKISVEVTPDGIKRLRIIVSDNGTGIRKEDLDRLFEPFFTTKEVGSGTGLGLSVSFGIVASMSGQLEAHNLRPHGAQFVITLPLQDAQPQPLPQVQQSFAPAPEPAFSRSEGRHLLLVDDEIQAVETMSDFLSTLGYRVSSAHNGTAALELYADDPADLVITDIRMPNGDGETLIRNLRDLDPGLPIIVATGHIGATEGLEQDSDPRLFVLMKKPISLSTLGETVENLLQLR